MEDVKSLVRTFIIRDYLYLKITMEDVKNGQRNDLFSKRDYQDQKITMEDEIIAGRIFCLVRLSISEDQTRRDIKSLVEIFLLIRDRLSEDHHDRYHHGDIKSLVEYSCLVRDDLYLKITMEDKIIVIFCLVRDILFKIIFVRDYLYLKITMEDVKFIAEYSV
ncbi:unnamed protein product [Mytilus edulis]|uniref:Uncharacterized protein n=1 Tax=Mytilus edulis TaxID=6550 RepID=A0A8S3Q2W7_MYTED|nr:unnamed protein product [Mytilus edulis]